MERRNIPRFGALAVVRHFTQPVAQQLDLTAAEPFWTVRCPASLEGKFRKLLFRIPEVSMTVSRMGVTTSATRVLSEVLVSPVPGISLPDSLEQLAALLDPRTSRVGAGSDAKILFGGEGLASYADRCEVETLAPFP